MNTVVVDCKSHLLGRVASIVAKKLLLGQKVVLVRCEEMNIAGPFMRSYRKYQGFLNKRTNYNPTKGPFHHRAPSAIVYRVIRGMVPHKTARGMAALGRLSCIDGCPAPYDKMKRMVITDALRVSHCKADRPYTRLARLSTAVGWKHAATLEKLEDKRLARSKEFYEEKKKAVALREKAVAQAKAANPELFKELESFGF
ncbi:putative multi-domain containing protein [Aduncisulcus paluster]|uniref:Multi-domain containing protein n=1 Tax=Aduncisulcus paluster TaxID=2918883 RepID=A0ABQ5K3K5_9EUKA|nr:putative multi-domain containing protein [Aduncisulcus paluster]